MPKSSPAQQFWTYITECLGLLYWLYFKPFTLERWLRDIHPNLYLTTNILEVGPELATNPRLERLVGQIFWLAAIVPLLITLLIGIVYSIASEESFQWSDSGFFLLGWMATFWFRWQYLKKKSLFFRSWVPLILILLLLGMIIFTDTSSIVLTMPLENAIDILVRIAGGIAVGIAGRIEGGIADGIAGGIAGGIAFGITFTIAVGIVGGIPGGIAVGIAGGIAGGIAVGIAGRIAGGIAGGIVGVIAGGIAGGITGGIAGGIAVGILFILGVLRFYFWLPELLWIVFLTILTPSTKRAQRLRYLPHWYDEIIHQPLPFVDRWIVDAYGTNPAIARQMITYLIASTNNKEVAAQAIVEIAVERLGGTQTTSDIAASSDKLEWIPSPPPLEAGPALPKLLEISRDVGAAINATSLYRQHKLLNGPIKSLQDLANQLAFGQNIRSATTYGTVVQKWPSILETAQRTLQERALETSEIPQAYVVGPALDPQRATSRFKGRQDLFREIETIALSDLPPILLLQGGRRTGKSSTLNYLPERLPSRFVPLVHSQV